MTTMREKMVRRAAGQSGATCAEMAEAINRVPKAARPNIAYMIKQGRLHACKLKGHTIRYFVDPEWREAWARRMAELPVPKKVKAPRLQAIGERMAGAPKLTGWQINRPSCAPTVTLAEAKPMAGEVITYSSKFTGVQYGPSPDPYRNYLVGNADQVPPVFLPDDKQAPVRPWAAAVIQARSAA